MFSLINTSSQNVGATLKANSIENQQNKLGFKSDFDFISDGLGTVDTIRGIVEHGDFASKLFYNKSIYSNSLLGKAFKGISWTPTTKAALKFASKISPEVYRPVKSVVDIVRKTPFIKAGSKVISKKVPVLGLGIASYNIRQSYKERGNSFDFYADAAFEVADAFIPFIKNILEDSAKYEAKKAQDYLENRDKYLFMPLHAGKI